MTQNDKFALFNEMIPILSYDPSTKKFRPLQSDSNGKLKTLATITANEIGAGYYRSRVAGNATHNLGSAGQVFEVLKALYHEAGAATPACRVYIERSASEVSGLGPTVTVTASATTDLDCRGVALGDDDIKCVNGAAGDVYTILAKRLG